MTNMTLSIPEDLHALIRRHPEVSWSAVAREAMWGYARKVELLDRLTGTSKLSDADVDALTKQIKKAVRRRHGANP